MKDVGSDYTGPWRSGKDRGLNSVCVGRSLEGLDQVSDIISNLCFKRTTLATDFGQDCRGCKWEQRGELGSDYMSSGAKRKTVWGTVTDVKVANSSQIGNIFCKQNRQGLLLAWM